MPNLTREYTISNMLSLEEMLLKMSAEIEARATKLVKDLTTRGEAMAAATLPQSDYSQEGTSISATISKYTGTIMARGSQVVYIEFGTGIVGAQNPEHPKPSLWPGYMGHDVNKHGSKGWYFPIGDRSHISVLYGKKVARYQHTTGRFASAFMYRTAMYVRREFSKMLTEGVIR